MKRVSFLILCILGTQNIYSQTLSESYIIPIVFDFGICGVIQTNTYDTEGHTITNGYGGLGLMADLSVEFSESLGILWGWDIKWLPIGTTNSYAVYKVALTEVETIDDSQGEHEGIGCFGASTYIALAYKTALNENLGMLISLGLQCSWQEENQRVDITYSNAETLQNLSFKKKTTDIGPMIAISLFKNHNRSFSSNLSVGLHSSLILFRYEETFINDNRIYLKNNYLGFEIMPCISWSL
jgi:hypothetical protein